MSKIEKMYENANIKPEYRYDCNLADTIKPVVVYSLCSCSKGEIKDYCTNKQDYRYCKVYKVNKIYPPFTAEKQLEIVKMILFSTWWMNLKRLQFSEKFSEGLAQMINELWQSLTEEEKQQVKGILK